MKKEKKIHSSSLVHLFQDNYLLAAKHPVTWSPHIHTGSSCKLVISELLSCNFSFQTDHPMWPLLLLAQPRTPHVHLWSLIDLTTRTRSLFPEALLFATCSLGTSLRPGAVLLI